MAEVLLRPNVRVLVAGMIVPAILATVGVALGLLTHGPEWLRVVGWVLAAMGGVSLVLLVWQSTQPRLAYRAGRLLIYLQFGSPIRLPIEVLECAFLGAGPLHMPGGRAGLKSANLVIRLAEKEPTWAARPVVPALGRWADGYITIHGAWCEPLTVETVQRLNNRLHELKQQWAGQGGESP